MAEMKAEKKIATMRPGVGCGLLLAAMIATGCRQVPPVATASDDELSLAASSIAAAPPPVPPARVHRQADFGRTPIGAVARDIALWVIERDDSGGLPFVIVDKVAAQVYVFDASGRLMGASPALLGSARGDESVPGIGEKPLSQIRPEERTTPAGRFVAEMGVNLNGEDILWVDYDAAVSMHRVRAHDPKERRLQRLASPTPKDNRISYGCINLPVAFFETVLKPLFEPRDGIVYVLPETRTAHQLFGLAMPTRTAKR